MNAPAPRAGILDIKAYVPGRSSITDSQGRRVIKLSSNESALGPSPRAVEAAQEAAAGVVRYPDGSALDLREAIARRWDLDPERIVCSNGSDEILQLLPRIYAGPGDEVLYSQYGFAIYPIAAMAAGATPVSAPERSFRVDVEAMLAAVTDKTKLVFLANPNNPTGSVIPASDVARLRAGLPDHVLLVIDSAYAEFVTRNDYRAGAELVHDSTNTVMTRTFSKVYSLAGLRVGWMYGPPDVVDAFHRVRGPFNVNAVGQAAATAALDDPDHLQRAIEHNDRWLPELTRRLKAIGLDVPVSVVNFVLTRFPGGPSQAAAAERFLASRAILVRDLGAYGIPDGLRINIGLDDEMEALIDSLTRFMGET